MLSPRSRFATVLTGALALSILVGAPAEARRGGSFGSRGARTYSAPPPTKTAPHQTAPVERSMTAQPPGYAQNRPASAATPTQAAAPRRPGLGMAGGLLAGLVTGGLIGALLGHGFGGLGGMGGIFAAVLQGLLLAAVVMFAIRLFRRRRAAPAAAPANGYAYAGGPGYDASGAASRPQWTGAASAAPQDPGLDISVTMADRETFQRMLSEVQDAFSRENYGALRELTTPEVMSYLAEELSQNATHGRRNDVSGTKLLSADIAEAWREGDVEYATAAMNYESIDVMRDRDTGRVLEGDPDRPTATTELWTFTRRNGGAWKLSAIQQA